MAQGLADVFCKYNSSRKMLTDNGPEFNNEVLRKTEEIYRVERLYITAYHPQGNGLVERTNRKITELLRPLSGDMHENWED